MATFSLKTRQLGKNGPHVSALGFGAMGLSTPHYGSIPDDETRFELLDRLYRLGCTNWDTADGHGDSEELLGKWFKRSGKREDIFLATKFGQHRKSDGMIEYLNDPQWIRDAVDRSLEKLQTDHIDLWYCHRVNGQIPIEVIIGTMSEAVKAGKVKYLGLSECSAETLRRASKVWPIHAAQMEYSPISREIEDPALALLKTCRELGIATIAYSPLERGMFTGRFKSREDFEDVDFRLKLVPRFSEQNLPRNLKVVEIIESIAEDKGCTPGQLTLAWLLNQGEDIIPIPGTKNIEYLEENLGALDVKLTYQEDKKIRQAVETAEVYGTRYPPPLMKLAFLDTPPIAV